LTEETSVVPFSNKKKKSTKGVVANGPRGGRGSKHAKGGGSFCTGGEMRF